MDNDELILEALPPMQDKNCIYAPGRFNPPTRGHYKVFNAMKRYIREHPEMKLTPVIVVVAGEKSSLDLQKNPLSAEDRIKFMEASGLCNGFKFFTAKNGNQAAGVCRDNGFEPIVIAVGSDRADGYIKNLDKFFTTPEGEPIEHHVLGGLDRIESSVATKKSEKAKGLDDAIARMDSKEKLSDDEISASLARRAAELGYFEEFADIVALDHKPELARKMYDKIRTSLGVESDA